jgi:hypothetical protein
MIPYLEVRGRKNLPDWEGPAPGIENPALWGSGLLSRRLRKVPQNQGPDGFGDKIYSRDLSGNPD